MSKNLYLQLDDELVVKAESILEDMGLDSQTFCKMCFKKLIKEGTISFLTNSNTNTVKAEPNEYFSSVGQNVANEAYYPKTYTKNVITATMRDYIWELFKSQYNAEKKLNCSFFANLAAVKTGIAVGSAYIYFLILDNWIKGLPNTRTMKFDDLVTYLKYIKEELPPECIENALKSLSDSVPYWEEHIQGYFAQKVSQLVLQYRQ